ncbi:MAG: DUF3047 domain-containing protein [Proteobacteria bacterium]|nr:DUF3047 domain-containing protein [Pseudomonadota bacterium]
MATLRQPFDPSVLASPGHLLLRLTLPLLAAAAALSGAPTARAEESLATTLTPFASAQGAQPPAAWHFATLPGKTPTQFEVTQLDGHRVLKVESNDSYGNLVHKVQVPLDASTSLSWRWRVDKFIDGVDLHSRSGDDGAAKLCVFFNLATDRLPVGEQLRLAAARKLSGEDVPSETLCYVWDAKAAAGETFVNAFTRRIRMMVLRSGPSTSPGGWATEQRNVLADYRRAFGDEAAGATPDISAIAVSADADNTHGSGLSYFTDLSLSGPTALRAQNAAAKGTAE